VRGESGENGSGFLRDDAGSAEGDVAPDVREAGEKVVCGENGDHRIQWKSSTRRRKLPGARADPVEAVPGIV